MRGSVTRRVVYFAIYTLISLTTAFRTKRGWFTSLALGAVVWSVRNSNWPFHADRADIVLIEYKGVGTVSGVTILVIV